ncbi:zeta toxin family protein [Mycobacterium sp. 1274761.0]|uniref:zeta toxin family protein n=1 Tax=Mycobacterium sp. 1274761.0 TaxID=1834077 RepID=UPI0007FBD7BB|nr:zeta toxin family protein [Mycobacterium sp. 1274761.0]OBK72789.1 ZTL protein [Mycobacterium sp. 1274761.0]
MARKPPRIYVLAGVNGAGKSSVGGAMLRAAGATYFDPDEAAKAVIAANPGLDQIKANAAAWRQGKRLLDKAIRERLDFAFETTLGGSTMARLLGDAAAQGTEVRIWYVGLASPEDHIARVAQRVRQGGHDIPEGTIRRRWRHSRQNLIQLLPALTELRVYDNSGHADPAAGETPEPTLVLHFARGDILGPSDLSVTPQWAKPIVAAALKMS